KDFLRDESGPGHFRILYAHDILNNDGAFSFREKVEPIKARPPFAVTVGKKNLDGRRKATVGDSLGEESSLENYCNSFRDIIICRRRSHKGDKRRFVGLHLTLELPKQYFLENGINFISNSDQVRKSSPSLAMLYRILRSDLFERYFASISSNTQLNKNDMYLF